MSQDKPYGFDEFTKYVPKPVAAQEPIAWHTDDHLTDKSATTYDRDVAERWEVKGWPVAPLYGRAATCTRCAERSSETTAALDLLDAQELLMAELQAKITEQAAEIELYRAEMSAAREVGFYSAQELYMAYANQAAEIAQLSDHVEDAKEIIQKMMKVEKQQAAEIERSFQMLEINGVPRDRARYVSTGIEVLETRLSCENADLRARCENAETIAEAARNLIAQKGRHNTEIAYKRLSSAIEASK